MSALDPESAWAGILEQAARSSVTKEIVTQPAPKRSCNLHRDCDAADAKKRAAGSLHPAVHFEDADAVR